MSTSSPSLTDLFFFSEYAWAFIMVGGFLCGASLYAFVELSLLGVGAFGRKEKKDVNKED